MVNYAYYLFKCRILNRRIRYLQTLLHDYLMDYYEFVVLDPTTLVKRPVIRIVDNQKKLEMTISHCRQ